MIVLKAKLTLYQEKCLPKDDKVHVILVHLVVFFKTGLYDTFKAVHRGHFSVQTLVILKVRIHVVTKKKITHVFFNQLRQQKKVFMD